MRWWQVMPRASGYGFLPEEWPTGAGEADTQRPAAAPPVEWRGWRTLVLLAFILIGSMVVTVVSAQDGDGIPQNGPARVGHYHVEAFPTLTQLDWSAFPANPARPYVPADGGRTIFVATTGDDTQPGTQEAPLATLEAAAALAQSGDVIWVMPGEYPIGGPDNVYEALILDTPGVTLASWEIGRAQLVPSTYDPAVAIYASADALIIDGFVIRGLRSAGIEYGRIESPQRHLVLKHLSIEQTQEGILGIYGGDGVQPIMDGMLIDDLRLTDISLIGLQCGEGPCNNLRWENLTITMPSDESSNSGADALAVESGDNVLIVNAEISGAEGDGIDLKSTRNVVVNALVHDLGRNGIKLWHGGDVINCLVYGTGADAALVFEAGEYRVLNTLVARHNWGDSSYGMTVAYDSQGQPGRLEIINSVFYQNAGAIWVSPSLELMVQNSVFFGSGNGEEIVYDPHIFGANMLPISAIEEQGLGANNSASDPGFMNPDQGDFGWGPASLLLDGGTTAYDLPPFDLRGNPRVAGQGVDIGPYELPAE